MRQREKHVEKLWNERAKFESELWNGSILSKGAEAPRPNHDDTRMPRAGDGARDYEAGVVQRRRQSDGKPDLSHMYGFAWGGGNNNSDNNAGNNRHKLR